MLGLLMIVAMGIILLLLGIHLALAFILFIWRVLHDT